ncbi:LOW QUALITY PROTEIN: microtubule organization protein AKNA [Bufo gargarizans]|uniref:LOW QUALITY PROTEIN: microtubule organization protein AKNA n=1 Tax=Bufo gargarizans TaxID=30331 RepID=UPI001CF22F7F|nr:LOW QUALITY PROTEIN: microtubule organization protein AKNA [Bufo gargarizans]
MDSHNRQQPSDSSDEEENRFSRYMDENGVIGMDEEELLGVDSQGDLEGDEEQVLAFDEEGMMEMYKDGVPYAGTPSEDERFGVPSWQEDFSLSGVAEERAETLRNGDGIVSHDTEVHSLLDHPSRSVTLPSALDRHPPSRDQQLDMTEDEVDRGSSLGAWDEDDNWNQTQSELLDESPGHRRYEEYEQTSLREEHLDENPKDEVDYSESLDDQEDCGIAESPSPSSPPVPSTWDTRLMSRFGRLSITPRIEDETLPESSCTESGGIPEAIPGQIPTNVSKLTRDSKQARNVRSKPTSAPTRTQHVEPSTVRRGKHSTTPLYGRGQLNYPLPDFSKVGPKVRFPRDEEGYRPPQPRRPEKQNLSAPVIFKSPAEIVREVLLSSTERPVQEPVVPPAVPQEFKTPQQATVLVHQLQEDYHKLLTKYAEAENTIDRLRLGAKVHLYSDPPQPSHSIEMGTVTQGTKVMEFSIPHAQAATFSSVNDHHGATEVDLGSSEHRKPSVTPPVYTLPEPSGSSSLHPPEDVASTLMSHLETLHQEVELLEELLRSENLTPEEQRQAVQELCGSLDVLERRYLKAQEQQRTGSGNLTGELDPQRELEEAIFQLGVQLEEIQERVENSSQSENNLKDTLTTHHLGSAPVPSASVPTPALQTPYPQISSPEPPGMSKADAETLSKEDPAEYLPQPLLFKHKQVERDYGTLLSTYSSFKSLPEALGLEQEEWPQQLPQNAKPHNHPQDVNTQGRSDPVRSQDVAQKGRPAVHSTSVRPQEARQDTRPLDPITSVKSRDHEDHLQTVSLPDHPLHRLEQHTGGHQNHPITSTPQAHQPTERSFNNLNDVGRRTSAGRTPSRTELRRSSSVLSGQRVCPDEEKPSALRRMSHGSKTFPQRVSLSSSLPHAREQHSRIPTAVPFCHRGERTQPTKRPLRANGNIAQRILSPETDSGFLGSESGRSQLIRKQRDQLSLTREDPEEVPDSNSNLPSKGERRSSVDCRTRKALWDKRKPKNHWTGPSEASSPSPGPKSLTESESREHTDESGSEQEAYNDVSAEPSPGASQLLSPMEDLTQPLEDVLHSRTARDQAIHSLQKEVSQLRKHLENSLHRSPIRGKQTAANQNLHEGRVPNFVSDLGTPISRRGPPVKESREEHLLGSFVPRDHESGSSDAQGGRSIRGAYTGSQYQVSRSPPPHHTEHFTVPPCQRCQENERKNTESSKPSKKEKTPPLTPPDCPLCHGNDDSDDAPRTGMFTSDYKRRSRRRPHCKHWIVSHTPPVSYVQTPIVHYSPPIVYGTPASLYPPMVYNPPELRRPHSVTPPPSSDILQLVDLMWPLSKALEAAKELKSTSRRMCRSLTMDLSAQRDIRGSCLF